MPDSVSEICWRTRWAGRVDIAWLWTGGLSHASGVLRSEAAGSDGGVEVRRSERYEREASEDPVLLLRVSVDVRVQEVIEGQRRLTFANASISLWVPAVQSHSCLLRK